MATNKSSATMPPETPERFRLFHTAHDRGYMIGNDEAQAVFVDGEASTYQLACLAQARLDTATKTMRMLACCRSEVSVEPHEFAEVFLPYLDEVSQLLEVISARR
jgi:hypothetical protein